MTRCPACQAENDDIAVRCVSCGGALPSAPTAILVSVDLSPGTVFHGRYEIQRLLGRGGMGMVYLARDRTLDEVVAIKILRPEFAQDASMANRFKSEIKLARKIRHRHVGAIHDFGEERGLLYISMEFVEGVDLKQLLRQNGPFAEAEAYDLSIQVAEGLQAVHDAGVIHRDLKTPNIMRDNAGAARLMDFGIAKLVGSETATAIGSIVGTPEYMSPEQAQGHKVDFRSDLYALGIVIHEIFSGIVPFRGETPIATILKQIQEPPTLEGPGAPTSLPKDLIPVLRKCLAKSPSGRYDTAHDVAEALRRARSPSRRQQPLATEVLVAPTLQALQPPKRLAPVLLGGGAVALAAALGIGLWLRGATGGAPTIEVPPAASPSPAAVAATALPATAEPAPAATPEPTALKTLPPMVVFPSTATDRPATRTPPRVVITATAATVKPTTPPPAPTTAPVIEAVTNGREGFLLPVSKTIWAYVFVNGTGYESTPRDKIALPPGEYVVRFDNPLYRSIERRVTIRANQTEKVVVDFPSEGVRK